MAQPQISGEDNRDGPAGEPGQDGRLSWFASGGRHDRGLPDAEMARALEAAADASGRPPGDATDDEIVGMLGYWQALEAHAHARMLAAVREIVRRRAAWDRVPATCPGDLPRRWDIGVAHEVAAELRISWQSAGPLVQRAWELEARLPDVGRLLDEGVLTALKVTIVTDEFAVLDDELIAQAQKLLLAEDLAADDMTPGRLRRLCQKIVDTVDPEGARKRREDAARDRARVSFFRAHGGDTAMFAEGLPPDEALRCQVNIQARATDYKKAMVFPEAGMDFLRVLALVDLINGTGLDDRIARYHAEQAAAENARNAGERARDQETAESLARHREKPGPDRPPAPASGGNGDGGNRDSGGGDSGGAGPDYGWPDDDADDPGTYRYADNSDKPAPPVPDEEPPDLDDCDFWPGFGPGGAAGGTGRPSDDDRTGEDGPGHGNPDGSPGDGDEDDGGSTGRGGSAPRGGPGSETGPGETGQGGPGPASAPGGTRDPGLPALAHLTLPLATLLHLGERPGEAPG